MPPSPLVTAVVLNFNRRDDTLACLSSLARQTYPALRVLVLDMATTDGSYEAVAAQYPQVQQRRLTENRGYAGNNNLGIRQAAAEGAEWILVLNEDTEMAPDCVAQLVAEGERDARIGIVGPLVYHHDEPTVIQSAGGMLDAAWNSAHAGQNEPDTGQFAAARDVPWLSGCALLVRRALVEAVGALDERFFVYWEETEWCLRATREGWRIRHVPAAKLWHKGVRRDYRPGPYVNYYMTRNRLLLLHLHHAPLRVRAATWLQIARTVASWTLRPKWKDKAAHRDAMVRGARDYLAGRWGRMPQA